MNAFRRLIREAHRRSVWQVLGIYLVGAWIGYEVILNVMEGFGLPGWVAPFALVLFLIGLPIVVATAFVQEGGPERGDFARSGGAAGVVPSDDSHALVPGFSTPADDLAAVPPPVPSIAPAPLPAPAGISGRLTWPRAILGGVLAFLVLAVSTAGWMGMREAGIGPMGSLLGKGELHERDAIVLAQFTSAAGDTVLSTAVTEAFRVDFEQSPIVRLVGPQQVRDVLRRMQREGNERLTEELAREIAEREGYKAVLSGEVNPVAGGWVLSARLLAVDGRVLASARETASDSTGVLAAIDGLSKTLRERIGESLRTIRGNAPLEQVTTASMEALRKYTQSLSARDAGDTFRALELLQEAVAIDPGFAMAWRKMAAVLSSPGMDRDLRVHAATRAYELRERLTDKERHLATAGYHAWVLSDDAAAARAYRSVLDLDPDETTALNNLSLILKDRGEFEAAAELSAHALEIGGSFVFFENHAESLYYLGRTDEALAVMERAREHYPDNPIIDFIGAVLRSAAGDYAAADSTLETSDRATDPNLAVGIHWMLSSLDAVRGRLREALEHTRDMERGGRVVSTQEALGSAGWRAELMLALADTAAAIATVDEALGRYPMEQMAPLQRPYVQLASFFARARHFDRARGYLTELERNVEAQHRGAHDAPTLRVHALLQMAEGDLARAETTLMEAYQRTTCDICELDHLAAAYAEAGNDTRAIELYERFLATPYAFRTGDTDAQGLGPALLHLAELYERAGNGEAAARNYARFIELWQNADPDLRPRVNEARRRLEGIVQRRG